MKKFEVGKTYVGSWHNDNGLNSEKYIVIKRSENYATFYSEQYGEKRVKIKIMNGEETAKVDYITVIFASSEV